MTTTPVTGLNGTLPNTTGTSMTSLSTPPSTQTPPPPLLLPPTSLGFNPNDPPTRFTPAIVSAQENLARMQAQLAMLEKMEKDIYVMMGGQGGQIGQQQQQYGNVNLGPGQQYNVNSAQPQAMPMANQNLQNGQTGGPYPQTQVQQPYQQQYYNPMNNYSSQIPPNLSTMSNTPRGGGPNPTGIIQAPVLPVTGPTTTVVPIVNNNNTNTSGPAAAVSTQAVVTNNGNPGPTAATGITAPIPMTLVPIVPRQSSGDPSTNNTMVGETTTVVAQQH